MGQLKKILIIDDEKAVLKFLKVCFEGSQFQTHQEETGKGGLQAAAQFQPDLIILDLGLPDLSGIEVLQQIREWSQTPIIILTASDEEEKKVIALDSGADDYLTKPFGVAELLARVRVALRHSESLKPTSSVFTNGPLKIDFSSHTVTVNNLMIKLTSTEYQILRLLALNRGKVVTHRMILKEIWGPNSVEHTQYLRVYVGQIRKKIQLDQNIGEMIQTESGVGYRMLDLDDKVL